MLSLGKFPRLFLPFGFARLGKAVLGVVEPAGGISQIYFDAGSVGVVWLGPGKCSAEYLLPSEDRGIEEY